MALLDFSSPASLYGWLALLLRHATHNPIVTKGLCERLTLEHLRAVGHATPALCLVASAIRKHWELFKSAPGAELSTALLAMYRSVYPQSEAVVAPELSMLVVQLTAPLTFNDDVKIAMQVIADLHDRAVIGPSFAATLSKAQTGIISLDTARTELTSLSSSRIASHAPVNLLSKKGCSTPPPVSSGIVWLDRLIGGHGFYKSNCYLVIGPTGGGKTTLTAQAAISMALLGKRVAVVSTEQPLNEGRLKDKYWAVLTGKNADAFTPYDDEDKFPLDLLTDDHRHKAEVAMQNVLGFDFVSNPGTFATIEAIASQYTPDVIFVDWAGPLAKAESALQKGDPNSAYSNCLRDLGLTARTVADRTGTVVVVFHQLRSDGGLSPTQEWNHFDASDCKRMAHYFGYSMTLCPRDHNHIMAVRLTKARYGEVGEAIVRLDGAKSVLREAAGYRRGKGCWTNADAGTIPAAVKNSARDLLAQDTF